MTRRRLASLASLAMQLAACSQADERPRLLVRDGAGLLSEVDRDALASVQFPNGVLAVVHTIERLPMSRGLPGFAGALFEENPPWSPETAPSLLDRLTGMATSKTVFVLVSKEPRMVQVRYGSELVIPAMREGVYAGPGYRRWQEGYARASGAEPLRKILAELASALERGLSVPWYTGLLDRGDIGGFALDVLDSLVEPGDGLFTRYVLAPVARLVSYVARLLAPLGAVAVVAAVALGGVLLESLGRLVGRPVVRRLTGRVSYQVGRLAVGAWSVIVALSFTAALFLVASGRWEDERALELMGATSVGAVFRSFSVLAAPAPWWLALLTGVMMYLYLWGHLEIAAMHTMGSLPDSLQQELMKAIPQRIRDGFTIEQRRSFLSEAMEGDADEIAGEEFVRRPFTVLREIREQRMMKDPIKWTLGLLVPPGVLGFYTLIGTSLRALLALGRGVRAAERTAWLEELIASDSQPTGDDGAGEAAADQPEGKA